MKDFLSLDDLWSVIGWVFIATLMRVVNPEVALAVSSALGSAMLAIFWAVSSNVRARNKQPNIRIALWAVVAGASALAYLMR